MVSLFFFKFIYTKTVKYNPMYCKRTLGNGFVGLVQIFKKNQLSTIVIINMIGLKTRHLPYKSDSVSFAFELFTSTADRTFYEDVLQPQQDK
ncbi:hypothetical protein BLOT_013854 [Blomia tropicalis]|nr:hypothetical protein BLOT_013854 [Blomia tropicalis]